MTSSDDQQEEPLHFNSPSNMTIFMQSSVTSSPSIEGSQFLYSTFGFKNGYGRGLEPDKQN